ncbi:cytochrome c3 family protein [Aquimarina longa]|uniref:cytochrome c3 family protein n=1 Tax=Aquimarina longa TaxID=1080221 RepID=UPI000782F867|nr:cytochrome c3 family protein [Aquimarina longa]
MMNYRITYISGYLLLFMLLFVSCKHNGEEYHSLTDKIKHKSQNYHKTQISSEKYLEDKELIKITEGEHTFLIPERKGKIKSYACIECHSKPLDQMQNSAEYKKAHWDIKLVHATKDMMDCMTCHNGNNMNKLTSLTGKEIDFNRSYKLCSQCHTSQFDDWKGGAHGKKIVGWAPPRASMTCVNCHNPHNPSFKKRWPARFNTQVVKERKDELE